MKKISLLMIFGFMVFTLVACQSVDELSRFQRQVGQSLNTASKFDDQNVMTLDSEVLLNYEVTLLGQTSLQNDLSTQDKIERVQQLIQEIVKTRFENIALYEENQLSWADLKSNVSLFKQAEQTLLETEKQAIRTLRVDLVEKREAVIETTGEVKTLLGEIQGKFNLDHLDLVISNLEKVLEILELRQAFLIFVADAIQTVNQIALSHLS